LAAGVLLIAALGVFLVRGKWKNPLNLKDLPHKLGYDIQSDASGYTLEHALGAHSRYKIHASKAVQFKAGRAVLHDVKIEMYSDDGKSVDRIEGAEFDYNENTKTATAAGPVEITLARPAGNLPSSPAGKPVEKTKLPSLPPAAAAAANGDIHVKTSGLSFNEQTGVATTDQEVDFSTVQGSGHSTGATYDSQKGFLVLDRAVELTTERGGQPVAVHAAHAEFTREDKLLQLRSASADYRGGQATAVDAKVLFRDDGTAVRLDATNGFTLATSNGGHIASPVATLEFGEHNQPHHGHLEGGVRMDETRAADHGNGERRMDGTAPTAELEFNQKGEVSHGLLQRGVEMHSEQQSVTPSGPLHVNRTWKSPIATIDFRDNGHGQTEPAMMHGTEGVVVTGQSQRGQEPMVPSRLSADEVTGTFAPGSVLSALDGQGHASLEETAASGTHDTSTGDALHVQFAPPDATQNDATKNDGNKSAPSGASQIQSAVLDGHVILVQDPAAKPGSPAPASLRATAGKAVYEGQGEWLHLTLNPRVEDGGLQLTADKVDVSHQTGDAFAHGNVKATWEGNAPGNGGPKTTGTSSANPGSQPGIATLGGQGPTHVVAAEAQLHQPTGEATFRGHARLWQQANSVAAPVIVLDRQKQTLVATTTDPAEPVRTVMVSAGGAEPGASPRTQSAKDANGKQTQPSVIRVRGGDLKYSDAERNAFMHSGVLKSVVSETGTATTESDEVHLVLLPAGNHAGKDGGQAQVDRMTANGHVIVNSQGRRGTGEELVYTGEDGNYVLTGTSSAPPKMNDPARGTVSGAALIFNSRDDSVSIEGDGRKTTTDTTAPK
jgi:lipopolysaccharide export system protein LptA